MRPNVLFILVDGLRADQCYSADRDITHSILGFLNLNEGVYFNNTFSLLQTEPHDII